MSKVEVKKETNKHRYNRDKMREKVRGIFRFYEVPGGSMSFVYKEFKEDPVERFDMIDGEVYTIPLGVARHLNKNGWYPEYEYIKGEAGVHSSPFVTSLGGGTMQTTRVGKKVRRFGFQSLEFIDPAEIGTASQSELLSVETVI